MAKGDVIYRRSLHETEVKELRVGGIIHLGPLVNTEQTRAQARRTAQGSCIPGWAKHFAAMVPGQRVSAAGLLYRQGKISMPLGISRGLEGFFFFGMCRAQGELL